jgi:hypothetical protein
MNVNLMHIVASTFLALFLVILSVGAVISGQRERSAFLIGFGRGRGGSRGHDEVFPMRVKE